MNIRFFLLIIFSLCFGLISCTTTGKSGTSVDKVTLAWEDQSSNEQGFEIERKTASEGEYVQIATVAANTTTYTDTDLGKGKTYYYRIRAFNSHGHSPYTEEIRVTLP